MTNPVLKPNAALFVLLMWGLSSFPLAGVTQESDYRTTFADAEYYFLFNDMQEALPLYQKLLDENQQNANVCYRIGRCYLNIPGLKHMAIEPLLKAVDNINQSYQEGSYREVGAPPDAYFYLGEAYRIEGQFPEAIAAYEVFRGMLDSKDVYNLDYIDQQVQACHRANEMKKRSKNLQRTLVVTGKDQAFVYGAAISCDSKCLLFTVKEKFYDAIYISEMGTDGEWHNPKNITLDIGLEGEIFSTSINHDGTEIFIFKNDSGVGNIYSSTLVDGQWQKAKKIGKPINSRHWETFASVSPNGETLFFSSNRRGGFGGLDLYQSKRLSSGEWSEAQNLGEDINTPHNEEAPHLSTDGSKLYFISQGHNTLGGYDVFYSQLLDDGEWSSPINLGYPISTPDDDMWYYPLDENKGIVSQVERGKPNISNLYLVSLIDEVNVDKVTVKGELQLANNYEVQGDLFSVSLINAKTKDTIICTTPQDIDGQFYFDVSPGEYRIVAQGVGYVSETLPIAIPKTFSESSFNVSIKLKPTEVEEGKYLAIRSVLFGFDSDTLSDEAVRELEKLYAFLHQNTSVEVEVCGHTDSKGSMRYNKKLSLRRANSVIDYLTQKGISAERFSARGASSLESIAQNTKSDGSDNPAGRQLNRRASIRVINATGDVDIVDELDVPEHLKVKIQNYTILLAPLNTNVDSEKLQVINSRSGLESYRLTGRQNSFAYALGQFNHKSEALAALNYAIDNGFPEASIVGEEDLKMLIR
jgi:outer membrane protein OmpA-like peptidoglycan-associated protein